MAQNFFFDAGGDLSIAFLLTFWLLVLAVGALLAFRSAKLEDGSRDIDRLGKGLALAAFWPLALMTAALLLPVLSMLLILRLLEMASPAAAPCLSFAGRAACYVGTAISRAINARADWFNARIAKLY